MSPTRRDWAVNVVNSGLVISNALIYIAKYAPLPGVKHAAEAVSIVFSTIDNVQSNKEDFQIIADDAAELIIAIWRLQEKSENPKKWASPEIRDMVGNLKTALEKVNRIAKRQAKRNMVVRVIFNMTDARQIKQAREMINTAVSRFTVLSSIGMHVLLLEVAARQQELSQDMRNLGTPRVEEEEEEGEEEEFSHLPPNQTIRPAPANFSFSNGSGHMFNSNVGNIAYTTISNMGNNNSRNYY